MPTTDELGRPNISPTLRQAIAESYGLIEPGKRGAVLLVADTGSKTVTAHIAAKIDNHWKVAAGSGWEWGKKSPGTAFVAVAGSW